MSDAGRKNFSDKVSETVKPDSQKSTLEKGKEVVTDKLDGLAANTVPDSEKSFGQTVADNAKKGHDDAKAAANENQATLAETAQEYFEAAKTEAAKAAEYVSSVVTGGIEGAKNASDNTKK